MHPDVRSILRNAEKRADSARDRVTSVDSRNIYKSIEERRNGAKVPIITEVKPTSPTSQGTKDYDPVVAAKAMERGGACGISVLTEPQHFGGSLENLRRVRSAVDLPVLRKDFIVDKRQLREVESDLILLIAAFIDDLQAFVDEALDIGFEPLVEVHTPEELDRALETEARIIGVNNRDLKRLEVDMSVCETLLPEIPEDRISIAESGIKTPTDVRRMVGAGADALLVGTAVMRSDDIEERTRTLVESLDRD
ncbi:MAG: indole-3-glycerol-phosphate synthase [Halobacteria archaeon]|nr:indole-3-glycerol-phosphate synthase [Halobacteria archaeon]